MDGAMDRREFVGALGAAALLGTLSGSVAAPTAAEAQGPQSGKRPSIAMLVHSDMILPSDPAAERQRSALSRIIRF
jgi:hypothetical protein